MSVILYLTINIGTMCFHAFIFTMFKVSCLMSLSNFNAKNKLVTLLLLHFTASFY